MATTISRVRFTGKGLEVLSDETIIIDGETMGYEELEKRCMPRIRGLLFVNDGPDGMVVKTKQGDEVGIKFDDDNSGSEWTVRRIAGKGRLVIGDIGFTRDESDAILVRWQQS